MDALASAEQPQLTQPIIDFPIALVLAHVMPQLKILTGHAVSKILIWHNNNDSNNINSKNNNDSNSNSNKNNSIVFSV